jgi:hypothetical protein
MIKVDNQLEQTTISIFLKRQLKERITVALDN